MSINRIQKLLFSEYCEFEDMVLVESPFAQTTREGQGIRQVHIGLTPTKLVLATDVLPKATEAIVKYVPGIDPDVETFELIAVYPIECVKLSIFHRKKRQALKARFTNNKVLYFEMGGQEKKNMFWNLWCERIRLLTPNTPGSSHSETSVATSTTNSTLYIQSSRHVINENGTSQIWFEYGKKEKSPVWTDKTLFAGNEAGQYYYFKTGCGDGAQIESPRNKMKKFGVSRKLNEKRDTRIGDCGLEIENRNNPLFIPAENYIVKQKFSDSTTKSADVFTLYSMLPLKNSMNQFGLPDVAENCVRLWEYCNVNVEEASIKLKHKRRYALAPQPHFLLGLGPWNVTPGERYSIQIKRALSQVTIRRQPVEPELRLPVSKRQLIASVSCEGINIEDKINDSTNAIKTAPKSPVIFFWTPDYWYRPRSAKETYVELRNHLHSIRNFREEHEKEKVRHSIFRKKKKKHKNVQQFESDEDSSDDNCKANKRGQTKQFLKGVFSRDDSNKKELKQKADSSLHYLKKILKVTVALTAWDFDSTTLAYQLTIIDRDLFLKIPAIELGVLLWQQSSKNAPNIGALIAFSHRVSCLVTTEVLKDDSEKIRARLVARFINIAEKCNRICNFQSCKSILNGLQSPPMYRLHSTWNYVRKRHGTKYQMFEQLCRQYRDPRQQVYQNAFQDACHTVPYLPYIGDIICKLLSRIPNYEEIKARKFPSHTSSNIVAEVIEKESIQNINITHNENIEGMTLFQKLLSLKTKLLRQNIPSAKSIVKPTSTTSKSDTTRKSSLSDCYRSQTESDSKRLGRLEEVVQLLEKYQQAAAHYRIGKNELAREYLLKARYREERENFVISLNLEEHNVICSNK